VTVRLIATDLDGTLLRDDLTVSARTRKALDAARDAGVHVVPVTARQPHGLREIAEEAGFAEWALCSNGALGIHLATERVLFDSAVTIDAQRALVAALDAAVPGVVYASVRDGGTTFVAQVEYAAMADFDDHKLDPRSMRSARVAEVLAEPSLKFIARHPDVSPAELLVLLRELAVPGVEITHSGAPFLEIQAEGVTKASGLALLCSELGVDRGDVLAFGDAPNDVEMLAWAGRGVAMAHAVPEARAVADDITTSNEDDGVAHVIEALLVDST
jgi:Cof subfamily protein (haloacid dehalogenase superfamily)